MSQPQLKCYLEGPRLRALSKAVRALSKHGEYVSIQAKASKLILQAVNDASSAFVEIIFQKEFFSIYRYQSDFDCKVDIKSLILVFRIINLDRMVEKCNITMDSSYPEIVFKMKCKNSSFKEYGIPFKEGQGVNCPRVADALRQPSLISDARSLSSIFKYFAQATKEATLWLFSDHVRFRTFIELDDQFYFDLPVTSFSSPSIDFSEYHFQPPPPDELSQAQDNYAVTFNIRDLKVFFDFALYLNQTIDAYLPPNAKPIEFYFKNSRDCYSARTVLSTLDIPDSNQLVPPTYDPRMYDNSRTSQSRSQNASVNESLHYSTNDSFPSQERVQRNDNVHANVNDNSSDNVPNNNEAGEESENNMEDDAAQVLNQNESIADDLQNDFNDESQNEEANANIDEIVARLNDPSLYSDDDDDDVEKYPIRILFEEDDDQGSQSDISHYVSDSDGEGEN